MKKVAVLTGGYSGEAEIAYQSADVVLKHLEGSDYDAVKVVIERNKWVAHVDGAELPIDANDFTYRSGDEKVSFDCVFMAIHGTPGEDGKLQGYFDMLEIPYTCCGVMAASITFNKKLCNDLLATHGFKVAGSTILWKGEPYRTDDIIAKHGLPLFVKPNNGGSSLGISKVTTTEELEPAIQLAFQEDQQIIIEEFVEGTEITCSVHDLDGPPKALAVTEIVAANEFFDFESKYGAEGTQEITPARIPDEATELCMRTTEKVFSILQCQGFIRADYILLENGEINLIEVNTVPGMSEMSLLPQQAVYAGYTLKEFFSKAIERALRN